MKIISFKLNIRNKDRLKMLYYTRMGLSGENVAVRLGKSNISLSRSSILTIKYCKFRKIDFDVSDIRNKDTVYDISTILKITFINKYFNNKVR